MPIVKDKDGSIGVTEAHELEAVIGADPRMPTNFATVMTDIARNIEPRLQEDCPDVPDNSLTMRTTAYRLTDAKMGSREIETGLAIEVAAYLGDDLKAKYYYLAETSNNEIIAVTPVELVPRTSTSTLQ